MVAPLKMVLNSHWRRRGEKISDTSSGIDGMWEFVWNLGEKDQYPAVWHSFPYLNCHLKWYTSFSDTPSVGWRVKRWVQTFVSSRLKSWVPLNSLIHHQVPHSVCHYIFLYIYIYYIFNISGTLFSDTPTYRHIPQKEAHTVGSIPSYMLIHPSNPWLNLYVSMLKPTIYVNTHD